MPLGHPAGDGPERNKLTNNMYKKSKIGQCTIVFFLEIEENEKQYACASSAVSDRQTIRTVGI